MTSTAGRAPIPIVEIELDAIAAFQWPSDALDGALVILRDEGVPVGSQLCLQPPPRSIDRLVDTLPRRDVPLPGPVDEPVGITVAVCTRERPLLLERCLRSIKVAIVHADREVDAELLVVDNASTDGLTRGCAERHGARWSVEPVAGLDVARNRAVAECNTEIIAFVDDDVVVDRAWVRTLARVFASDPAVGAVTGGVLALALDTPARVDFERSGGFSLGWQPARFLGGGDELVLRPDIGIGCNMAFRTSALAAIGPFDEALDTGRPMPGGGDLDILIRACQRAPVVYDPSVLVFHEHRASWVELRYQYYTWGLSWAAVIAKLRRAAPLHRRRLRNTAVRTMVDYLRDLVRGPTRTGRYRRWHCVLLAAGFVSGLAGAYGRSQRRMDARRDAASRSSTGRAS